MQKGCFLLIHLNISGQVSRLRLTFRVSNVRQSHIQAGLGFRELSFLRSFLEL